MEPSRRAASATYLVLLVISLVLLAFIVWPFASAFFLAAVLAGALWPWAEWLSRRFRGRRSLAAGLLCFGVVVALLLPVAGIATVVVREATEGVQFVQKTVSSEGVRGLVDRLPAPAKRLVDKALARLPVEEGQLDETVQSKVTEQGTSAARAVTGVVAATGSFVVQATMMLIALFFLLVDGKRLVAWLEAVSPLRSGQTLELLVEFRNVSVAVLVSTIATAGVQAVAALVGYLFTGVPQPLFFALLTFFVAFIPAIGAAGACLAAALLLLVLGSPVKALILAVWGILVVGLVDNVVKPLLVKRGMQMHGAIVFFALLGGLAFFGAVGLLIGPLAVAFFLALVRLRERERGPKPQPLQVTPTPTERRA